MLAIAFCESSLNPRAVNENIKDGKVWSRDYNLFQINDYYHEESAKKMGLDIKTVSGNIKYARHLYDRNHLVDWSASKGCWSNSLL